MENNKFAQLKLFQFIGDSNETPRQFENKIINIRKKLKENLQKQTIEFIANFYKKSMSRVVIYINTPITFEKDLINDFITSKGIDYSATKYLKMSEKRRVAMMHKLEQNVDMMIAYFIYLHNVSNIVFNMLNTYESEETKYVRNPMINFLKELDYIKEKNLIDGYLYEEFKQINDIRNIFLHEDYFTLILKLNVEDLKNIIRLLKIIDYALTNLVLTNKDKISSMIVGQYEDIDRLMAAHEVIFKKSYREMEILEKKGLVFSKGD